MRVRIFAFVSVVLVLFATVGCVYCFADDGFIAPEHFQSRDYLRPLVPFSTMEITYTSPTTINGSRPLLTYIGGQPFSVHSQQSNFTRSDRYNSLQFKETFEGSANVRRLRLETPVSTGDYYSFEFSAPAFTIRGSDFVNVFARVFQLASNVGLNNLSIGMTFTLDSNAYSYEKRTSSLITATHIDGASEVARFTSTTTSLPRDSQVSLFQMLDDFSGVPNRLNLADFISRGLIAHSSKTGETEYLGNSSVLLIRDFFLDVSFTVASASSGMYLDFYCPCIPASRASSTTTITQLNFSFTDVKEVNGMASLAEWVDSFFSFSVGNIAFNSIVLFALTMSLLFFVLKLQL